MSKPYFYTPDNDNCAFICDVANIINSSSSNAKKIVDLLNIKNQIK
jgi:hypothetical protein